MADDILNSAGEATLTVGEIVISELRVKVVDCRTNEPLKNMQTSKVSISNGTQKIERLFDRKKDTDDISDSDKIKGSMLALQKLGYETAATPTAEKNLPKNYNDTWRGYYNTFWSARVPEFQSLTEGDPSEAMMSYMIKEYNSHRKTDDKGLLRLQIPNLMLDDKAVTAEIGFFNFPVVLERVNGDSRMSSATVIRTTDTETTETGFQIKWNRANNQSTDWKGNFGWSIHKATDSSEFKFSEEIKVKTDTDKFTDFSGNPVSSFYKEETVDSPHFFLFALQWCLPIYDFIDDPDPDSTTSPARSNEDSFVNMKLSVTRNGETNEKWIRGLNMHIPSIRHKSGAYYGRRATNAESPQPRGSQHNGTDLYCGPEGDYPAFAVHAGKVSNKESSTYGYAAALALQGTGHPSFYYAHLGKIVTAKEWVMAGQVIGTSNISKNASSTSIKEYYAPFPYHLHFEFFKSAPGSGSGLPGYAKDDPRDKIEDFPGMALPSGAKYNIPDANDANGVIFRSINSLPVLFPCKSLFRSSDKALKTGENDSDFQYNYKCRVITMPDTSVVVDTSDPIAEEVAKTDPCYAINSFPYNNNRLKTDLNLSTPGLQPTEGLIKFVCPRILGSVNTELKMQAQIKWLVINKNRFTDGVFNYATNEEATFNGFFNNTATNLTVDGSAGNNTKEAIKCVIRAYYYCANPEATDRSLKTDSVKIDGTRIQAFIDKCVDSAKNIPDDDDHSIIRDFYDWFSGIDFSDMCLTA